MTDARSGIDPAELHPDIAPGDDFFRYVNGLWAERHTIPADRAMDGAFHRLRDRAEKHVRAIIKEAEAGTPIRDLYDSFMDEQRVDELGMEPLAADLDILADVATHEELAGAIGTLQRLGVGGLVGYYVFADAADATKNVVYLSQSGVGLPDEAYYRDDAYAQVRELYVSHIDRMAELSGQAFSGEAIMALETRIASHHWDVVKTREADLTYNPTTLSDLEDSAPGFPWRAWAQGIDLPEVGHDLLVASEPSFFTALSDMFTEVSIAQWKEWVTWRIVSARAPYLTTEASRANFSFYGTVLSGAEKQRARWKRGVGLVEGALGELVGQVYVQRHFPPSHKQRMDELVANLVEAYRVSIEGLEWMTDATKQRALAKLELFTPKIGYPTKWREYDGLVIDASDLMGNVRRSHAFEEAFEWAKLGKPVDREEWYMTPQTVNAYYNPRANEIVFPAAILQPPFFDAEADDAVNYGAIGSVIGHEIGHGFDDQGSKFDGHGNLTDWWTAEDREAFTQRTTALIDQFNGYSPRQLEGSHYVNGALTIGENIGDLAGLEIALKAYRATLGGNLDDAPVIDGLTGLQRYFIGYAFTEQEKARSEALITQISTDPHSPSEFRVNGIVRNMDHWYAAFEVGPEAELYLPETERVSIW